MMTRMKFYLRVTCLLSVVAFSTHAWTQEERQRQQSPATREAPPADAARGAAEINARNGLTPKPRPLAELMARGVADPNARNGGRDGQVPMRAKTISRTVDEIVYEPVSVEELTEIQAFQEARQALKDAKDEATRKTASEAIRQFLDKQFERDLAQREQDLAAVEERVRALRQQLERRTRSKDEIITLRLKTILNNAEGLGFPGEDEGQYRPSVVRQPGGSGRDSGVVGPDGARGLAPNQINKRERPDAGEDRGKEERAEPR